MIIRTILELVGTTADWSIVACDSRDSNYQNTAFGIFGTGLALASFVSILVWMPVLFDLGEDATLYARVEFVAVCIGVSLVSHFCSQSILESGGRLQLVMGAIAVFPLVLMAIGVNALTPFLLMLQVALCAVGISCCIVLWFAISCEAENSTTVEYTAYSFLICATFLFVSCFLFPAVLRVAFLCGYAFQLAIIAYYRTRGGNDIKLEIVDNKKSAERSKIQVTSSIMLGLTFFLFGYTISLVDQHVLEWCAAAATLSSVLLVVDSHMSRRMSEQSLGAMNLGCTVSALVALFMFDNVVFCLSLMTVTFFFTLYFVFGWSALARHVRFSRLSSVGIFGKARATDYLGVLIGIVVGWWMSRLAGESFLMASHAEVALMMLFLFTASFCQHPQFPVTKASIGEDASEMVRSAEPHWADRCRVIAEKYKLTERQSEVLLLIAQGRNAENVAEILTLSVSTVQTHIRNIYNKIGVHSRKELYKVIDCAELYSDRK